MYFYYAIYLNQTTIRNRINIFLRFHNTVNGSTIFFYAFLIVFSGIRYASQIYIVGKIPVFYLTYDFICLHPANKIIVVLILPCLSLRDWLWIG